MGKDRIVFGSDSVWYGSPQWQIEALWRFQISAAMREKYGNPELTETAKRKILVSTVETCAPVARMLVNDQREWIKSWTSPYLVAALPH